MKYTNLLVQYKGGGYDGCHWEWNFFCFDDRGQFHDLASSGYRAITTVEQAKALLNPKLTPKAYTNTLREDFYKFNLKSKKDMAEFAEESNPVAVNAIGEKLFKLFKKPLVHFKCDECGDSVAINSLDYPCMFHDSNNYTGNGGVGITQYGKLCEDCYSSHSCVYCGEFNEIEQNNVDDEGHCECCKPEVKGSAS